MRTDDAIVTRMRISQAIVATVNETPEGIAHAQIYGVISEYLPIHEFMELMELLVQSQRIGQRGDRYFPIGA